MRRDVWARRTGVVLQGLVLGALLVVALILLSAIGSDARIFRYQGF